MHAHLNSVIQSIGQVVLGKEHQIRLAVACLLAKGHLLLEDLPGMGKTTLAHALATGFGLQFNRVQFTSDLLPADVLGVSVYDRNSSTFQFHPGPVFTQVLLADEINRASPKTQSALLEVMEEGQVSIEGQTRTLPTPFFVMATQNPFHHAGTFQLPESQLDRFLMRIYLGYPDPAAERKLLQQQGGRAVMESFQALLSSDQLVQLQKEVGRIHVSEALLDYLQRLISHSREGGKFAIGLSPRAGLALRQAAQAWALIEGRDYALPEDIQAVFPYVAGHRLLGHEPASQASQKMEQLLMEVAVA